MGEGWSGALRHQAWCQSSSGAGKIDIKNRNEVELADLGPIPPAFDLADSLNEFAYRGYSLHPDGRSFLTSVLRVKTQIYLMVPAP